MIPARLTRPTVGLIPTMPLKDAGETIEPSVSVPIAAAQRFAATATADPELEPEVGPLAKIGLPENHGPGGAKLLGHERVARRMRSEERQRPSGRHHPIAGVQV